MAGGCEREDSSDAGFGALLESSTKIPTSVIPIRSASKRLYDGPSDVVWATTKQKLGPEARMAPAVTSDILTIQLRASCGPIKILTRFSAICKRRVGSKQNVFRLNRLFIYVSISNALQVQSRVEARGGLQGLPVFIRARVNIRPNVIFKPWPSTLVRVDL